MTAIDHARRAMTCLYLMVHQDVAKDIDSALEAALREAKAEGAREMQQTWLTELTRCYPAQAVKSYQHPSRVLPEAFAAIRREATTTVT